MQPPWLKAEVGAKNSAQLVILAVLGGLALLPVGILLAAKVAQNGGGILALRAIAKVDTAYEIERLPGISCQHIVAYDPDLSAAQMSQQIVNGDCFSFSGDTIQTIKPEHRYWLAISATAVEPDTEQEEILWRSLNLPVEYFFEPGMQALALPNLEAAHYWCRLALIAHPDSARANYCLGRVAQAKNQYMEAVASYRQATTAEQDLFDYERFQLYSRLGHILLDQFNQTVEARSWLEQATAIPVNCCAAQRALTYNRLGRISETAREFEEALIYYQEALAYDQNNPWLLRDVGRAAYRATDEWSLAQPYLTESLTIAAANRISGDNVILWLTTAQLFLNAAVYDELLPLLAKAPDHVQVDLDFNKLYAQTAALAGQPQLCLSILADALQGKSHQEEVEELQRSLCSDE